MKNNLFILLVLFGLSTLAHAASADGFVFADQPLFGLKEALHCERVLAEASDSAERRYYAIQPFMQSESDTTNTALSLDGYFIRTDAEGKKYADVFFSEVLTELDRKSGKRDAIKLPKDLGDGVGSYDYFEKSLAGGGTLGFSVIEEKLGLFVVRKMVKDFNESFFHVLVCKRESELQ